MAERELSFWGWGWADKFPKREGRLALGAMASALLGGADLDVADPPELGDIELPKPRRTAPETLARLCDSTPAQRVSHTYGKAYIDILRGFRGDFSAAPDFVARPESEDDVTAVLDFCGENDLAVIPFGGGTSVVRGVEPAVGERFAGAVSLDLRSLCRVLEVDDVSRAARIQAGATGPVLERQLSQRGFTLRHFPQSFEFSTLGGWLATRAGGHFATVYTHIDDLTESIRMLTPRGVWESRRLPGSGAGPSPDRMVLGSEGALGVITEAWMRVFSRPRYRAGASVRFSEFPAAVRATREIAQSGLFPTNCRLLDPNEARFHRVAGDGSTVLLLGFESADHALGPWIERALAIASGLGGTSSGPKLSDEGENAGKSGEAETWRAAFIDAPYLVNTLVSLGCIVDTFETACTWDRFDELHHRVVSATVEAMRRECGRGVVSMRFTHVYPDGPAPYYTLVAPGTLGGEHRQWEAIKAAASDALIAAGGTITHHHAVGRMHRRWYETQRPSLFGQALGAVKQTLDPGGILNPGVLV